MCSMETASEKKWQDVKELDTATTGTKIINSLRQMYHLSQFYIIIDKVDSLCCGQPHFSIINYLNIDFVKRERETEGEGIILGRSIVINYRSPTKCKSQWQILAQVFSWQKSGNTLEEIFRRNLDCQWQFVSLKWQHHPHCHFHKDYGFLIMMIMRMISLKINLGQLVVLRWVM